MTRIEIKEEEIKEKAQKYDEMMEAGIIKKDLDNEEIVNRLNEEIKKAENFFVDKDTTTPIMLDRVGVIKRILKKIRDGK